ncbi:AEC family transporter [Halobacterium litoreum]|uniref:AEC family transporter n=1 Tax=Halobacterium litoreum TaxID=2039234 RepID=A0ABD5NGN3_9EURY|nr:AEC family transporter [Halobacterium litoreum]UHH12908.1 AEC family transporter [Halobacterium litoreum]
MELVGRLLGLLALLLAGTALRAVGVLDETRSERLNAFAYYVALPALIFVSTYDQSVASLVTPALFAGHSFVLLATAGVAWAVHRGRGERAERSVAIVQSYHSNVGYLGFPLIAATFDARVTAVAGVVLGVVSLVQVPLTIAVFVSVNEADVPLRREATQLVANPVLLSLLAGLLVGAGDVGVPAGVAGGLDAVGSLALPTALLCVGASLDVDVPSVDAWSTGTVVALKVVFMPVLAWLVFRGLASDAATVTASVVMLGTPTAVSTFVFAGELGGDTEFASLNVFASTVASVATLFSLVALVG